MTKMVLFGMDAQIVQELKELWEKCYEFTEGSCWGEGRVEEFEDVVDTLEEADGEWISIEISIDHDAHTVHLYVHDDE